MCSDICDVRQFVNLPSGTKSSRTFGRRISQSRQHELEHLIGTCLGNGRIRNIEEHVWGDRSDGERTSSHNVDRCAERGFVVHHCFSGGPDDGEQLGLFPVNRELRR
jgi:hypothetical protein